MKTILYTLALLACSAATAQPVINQNDVFVIGTTGQYAYMLNPSVTSGNPGANQTYSMTGVTPDWTLTQSFVSLANSPFGQNMPATVVMLIDQGTSGASYFTKNASGLYLNGTYTPDWNNASIVLEEPYVPAMQVATFPMTYQQTNSGTTYHEITFFVGMDLGQGWVTDSIRRRTTEEYTYEIDGWGTLTTPAGTYTVLRQKTTTITYDSADYYRADNNTWLNNLDISQSLSVSYTFWAAGETFPVAEMLDAGDDGMIDDCIWITSITTGIEPVTNGPAVNAYPNPTNGIITLESAGDANNTWTLLDLNGRVINAGSIRNTRETLDFTALAEGVYMLKVENTNGITTKRIVIQH
ncbi:MAG: T9SS type A sorting domain-containing protein [Bacteroidia bacterium]|jgi:hypothetical protein|nr:T9SS type A sorting domain-containing protein [Bacteroidia bacterium]